MTVSAIRKLAEQATDWQALAREARMRTDAADDDEETRWLFALASRCGHALQGARSAADRGALIRELLRVCDNRLVLRSEFVEGIDFRRFGMTAARDGGVVKLLRTSMPEKSLLADIDTATAIDPGLRRVRGVLAPDAFFARLSAYDDFSSEGQRAALRAVVTMPHGHSLLAILPTGTGKSTVFHVGTRFWRESDPTRATVVIVPTVALALDHRRRLRQLQGLESTEAVTGESTAAERERVSYAFAQGQVPILLLSPEMALGTFRRVLLAAAGGPERPPGFQATLAAVVMDEAHLIESWGRHFRPDFQRLPALIREMRRLDGQVRVILLSATVSGSTRDLLRAQYSVRAKDFAIVHESYPRTEFDWVSRSFSSASERHAELVTVLDRIPRPAIVYTTEVDDAALIVDALRERGYERLAIFTGELQTEASRRAVVEQWSRDELDLVVATSAFGMGVDKHNVRAVVHACVPEDGQRLYQEIGRAGRDGHQALALTLWTNEDIPTAQALATKSWLGHENSIKRWRAMREEAAIAGRVRQAISGELELDLKIDARHADLGRHSGEYNRRWNMTLLALLQRAGFVDVIAPDEGGSRLWSVMLKNSALATSGQDDKAIREAVELALAERGAAGQALDELVALLKGDFDDCWMSSLFDLVEGEIVAAMHCGRCRGCRAMDAEPTATLAMTQHEAVWKDERWIGGAVRVPAGPIVMHAGDPTMGAGLRGLLTRLKRAGTEQFLVHPSILDAARRILPTLNARLGFLVQFPREVPSTARLPTAVLVPVGALDPEYLRSQCIELIRRFSRWPEVPLVFVISPTERTRGVSLSQHLSSRAPMDEAHLETSDS